MRTRATRTQPAVRIEPLEGRMMMSVASLDMSFGDGGLVRIDGNGIQDWGQAVAVQGDDKIIVAGQAGRTTPDPDLGVIYHALVSRRNPDGSPDASFGQDGVVIVEVLNYVTSIAVQGDGKILLGGHNSVDDQNRIVRLHADGSVDTSFGIDGTAGIKFGNNGFDHLAIGPGAKIIATTRVTYTWAPDWEAIWTEFGEDFGVVRFNPDGTLDKTFGGDGMVVTNVGNGWSGGSESVGAIAFLPGDRILIAGSTSDGSTVTTAARDGGFAFACFNDDGSLDANFGAGGLVVTRFAGAADGSAGLAWLRDVSVAADGSFFAAGESSAGGLTVAHYDATGALDLSYGANGLATPDGHYAGPDYRMAAMPDGGLLIGGAMQDVMTATVLDAGGGLVNTVRFYRGEEGYGDNRLVAFQADGGLVVVGNCAPTYMTVDGDFLTWYATTDILVGRFTFDFDTRPLPKPPVPVPPPDAAPGGTPTVGNGGETTARSRQEARRARREARRAARAVLRAEREALRERRRQERLAERERRRLERLQRLADRLAAEQAAEQSILA